MSKYIDAEQFKWDNERLLHCDFPYLSEETLGELIDNAPAADVVEVVRCRDCVMWDGSFTLNGQKKCLNMTFCTDGDFYCGWGSKE